MERLNRYIKYLLITGYAEAVCRGKYVRDVPSCQAGFPQIGGNCSAGSGGGAGPAAPLQLAVGAVDAVHAVEIGVDTGAVGATVAATGLAPTAPVSTPISTACTAS